MQDIYSRWREKYPQAEMIKVTYNDKGEEEILIINNIHISQRQQKREKQNAKIIESTLLSNVNLPNQLTFKPISKKQQVKEEKLKNFMSTNYLNYVRGGRKHYTYGLANTPMSRYDKWKTEFESQKDKKPKSFEGSRNRAISPTDSEGYIINTEKGRRILLYPGYNEQTLKNYKII
jgi:hypothetical protein